jgi:formylmethanofuran dehydrogenase subunit E
MIIPREISNREDYRACSAFHGHTCMGLTLGYLAAHLALDLLTEQRAEDEELICIAETDACACDAIQVLTGCTFGKGNFIYRDIGKMAFTFASRTTGEGVRLVMRPGVTSAPPAEQALAEKIRLKQASQQEVAEYELLHESRSQALFAMGPEGFFTVRKVTIELPPKARIAPSETCGECGEPVMRTKLQQVRGVSLCRDCLARGNTLA